MTPMTEAQLTSVKDRAVKILTTPQTEWLVIDAEAPDVARLYRDYIAILAAIPAICSFIGMSVVGMTLPLVGTYRVGMVSGFANAVVSYVLTLVGVYVSALIIDKLAPTFDSRPSTIQALKLVAYASTPVWLAGVLNIVPALSVLAILAALYAVYLFYLGLPVLMKTPSAKVVPYMLVSALAIIIVSVIVSLVAAALTGISRAGVY
jgi:hypothetical protein